MKREKVDAAKIEVVNGIAYIGDLSVKIIDYCADNTILIEY